MKKLVQFVLDRNYIQHISFWLLSFAILLFHFRVNKPPGLIDYLYTGLYHLALFLGVYINLRIAIPWTLEKGRYLLYFLVLNAILGAMLLFHEFTFGFLADLLFPGFYLISFVDYKGLIPYFVLYLIISSLLHLSKSWFQLVESERLLAQIQKEKFQAELTALKGQIHPHFLFNCLNNLYALSLKQSKDLPEMLLKLSDLMRYMIYEANAEFIPLKNELHHVKNYIALHKLRLNSNQTVELKIEGTVREQKIAPLIFINFIENAFKHGVITGNRLSLIKIHFQVFDDKVMLTVSNPKQQKVEDELSETGEGLGLANVSRRLALRYPAKHRLQFEEDDQQFKVKLELDL